MDTIVTSAGKRWHWFGRAVVVELEEFINSGASSKLRACGKVTADAIKFLEKLKRGLLGSAIVSINLGFPQFLGRFV